MQPELNENFIGYWKNQIKFVKEMTNTIPTRIIQTLKACKKYKYNSDIMTEIKKLESYIDKVHYRFMWHSNIDFNSCEKNFRELILAYNAGNVEYSAYLASKIEENIKERDLELFKLSGILNFINYNLLKSPVHL